MKTLRFLVVTALLSWVGSAAAVAAPPAPPANVNFVSERGLAFGMLLDGQPLTRPVARQVHVDRLAPGQHWAEFSVPTAYGPPLRFRTPVWLAPGLETSYVLVLRPSGPRLRQVGAVPVAGPAYGGGYYGGSYPAPAPGVPQGGYYGNQPTNQPYPNNQPYSNNQPYPNNAPYSGYPAPGQGGNAAPAPGAGYPGGYSSPPPGAGYPGGYGQGAAPDPNAGSYDPNAPNGNYLYPMPAADVQNLVQALRRQSSDDGRLPIVQQALAQNSVQAAELAELMGTLAFDKARIELAKFGYGRLSDPQNFYRVYDVLRYPSSIREVQQALGLPQN
jgi:hypothetical protein